MISGMALGVESMSNSGMMGQLLPPSEDDLEGQMGMSMPLAFALILRRHMEQYGTTLEQVAKIAVKNHHNSFFNPYCCFKKEFTVEEVLSSPMICDPITRYQCCANTDGAAALILCAAEKAAKYTTKPVYVAGSALNMGGYRHFQEDLCFSDVSYKTAWQAYEMAGIGPEDLDLVECHDPMAANEIFHYEELALCEKGNGGKMIEEGITELGGRIPVNPSGGLIGLGHPASASGARQLVELTYHLREEAGERQVKGAKVGLAHIIGGSVINLEAGVSAVHILKR